MRKTTEAEATSKACAHGDVREAGMPEKRHPTCKYKH